MNSLKIGAIKPHCSPREVLRRRIFTRTRGRQRMVESGAQRAEIAAILLLIAAATGACRSTMVQSGPAAPLVFYASQSGKPTLDQGEGGGNPFASALIELLERPSLTCKELHSDLIAVTKQKSHGLQVPEAATTGGVTSCKVKPIPTSEKRVALVFVYADYRRTGVPSLPGAERDLARVAEALTRAGFDVRAVSDPTRNTLDAELDTLSTRSEDAVAAIIYTTGHGFEHQGQVYLAPNDYPFADGARRLSERAVHVPSLANFLKAKGANLVFFGGCRTYASQN